MKRKWIAAFLAAAMFAGTFAFAGCDTIAPYNDPAAQTPGSGSGSESGSGTDAKESLVGKTFESDYIYGNFSDSAYSSGGFVQVRKEVDSKDYPLIKINVEVLAYDGQNLDSLEYKTTGNYARNPDNIKEEWEFEEMTLFHEANSSFPLDFGDNTATTVKGRRVTADAWDGNGRVYRLTYTVVPQVIKHKDGTPEVIFLFYLYNIADMEGMDLVEGENDVDIFLFNAMLQGSAFYPADDQGNFNLIRCTIDTGAGVSYLTFEEYSLEKYYAGSVGVVLR